MKLYLSIIFVLFSFLLVAQKNELPTVCLCVNNESNDSIQKICDSIYDTEKMSKAEKFQYLDEIDICKYPSYCDCITTNQNDSIFIKKCRELYNYKPKQKDTTEYGYNKIEVDDCENYYSLTYNNLTICDCINIEKNNKARKARCNEKFFKNPSEDLYQRMKSCIDSSNLPIYVTACDCILPTSENIDRACKQKFDTENMLYYEIKKYIRKSKKCIDYKTIITNSGESKKISLCDCLKEDISLEKKKYCIQAFNPSLYSKDEYAILKKKAEKCIELNILSEDY